MTTFGCWIDARGARLALEALEVPLVGLAVGRVAAGEQFLDGDVAPQAGVEGEVDAPERALTDHPLDPVAAREQRGRQDGLVCVVLRRPRWIRI